MIKGFWGKLNKPIMVLAPMEDVTDNAFREIIARHGKPDVTFTEFTSADGIMSEGRENVIHRFEYNESQRPIVAQIFSKNPDKIYETALLCQELKFDGIDINMGCPKTNICRQGAGSGMIKTPELAKEIILATKKGAGDLPVSVKTRLGYTRKDEMYTWINNVLEAEPVTLTIHGRTRKEMSKVPADWNAIKEVVEIRDKAKSETLIIGNGDVMSQDDGIEKSKNAGTDGFMVGRGIYGNPWFFNKTTKKEDLSVNEILAVLLEHTALYEEYFLERKNFYYMKKHYKSYIAGIPNSKDLKIKLLESTSVEEVRQIVNEFLNEL